MPEPVDDTQPTRPGITPPPGDTTGDPPAPPAPAATSPSPAPAATTPPAPADSAPGDPRFSQADLDRLIAERLTRERAKFSDYDEVKVKLKAIEDAKKTDDERIREELAAAQQRATTAELAATTAQLRAAVVSEATRKGFVDPMDAYRLVDVAKLTVSADHVDGLADQLDLLAKEKPYLLRPSGSPPPTVTPTNAARSGEPPKLTDAGMRQQYFGGGGNKHFWAGGGVVADGEAIRE